MGVESFIPGSIEPIPGTRMPPITFDGSSFMLGGQRVFLTGARFEYSLCAPESWADRLAAIRQQGFNTVLTSCPWLLHEPSDNRFDFEGQLDVAEFLRLARAEGLRVIMRIGPAVGRPFDGAGLPTWLADHEETKVREAEESFMGFATRWYSRLSAQVAEYQADTDPANPLVAVQIEHEWYCGSVDSGQVYLGELARYARECGFSVPLLTNNGFWQDIEQAIETWSGWDDMLRNLREVRTLQPMKPRIALLTPRNNDQRSSDNNRNRLNGNDIALRIGEIVATGGQAMLDDAVQSVHARGTAGSGELGPLATLPAAQTLLDESGQPSPLSSMVKRVTSFCSSFEDLLSQLDAENQTVTLDGSMSPASSGPAIVGMQGDGGSITWIFRGKNSNKGCTVMLDDGRRVPVTFGDAPLTWFVTGAALNSTTTLDYVNVSPYAVVAEKMLVLQGPAKATINLSINGGPADLKVPAEAADGGKPECREIAGITVVVCNQSQIDRSIVHDGAFHFGVRRIAADGTTYMADGIEHPIRIAADGTIESIESSEIRKIRKRSISGWETFEEPDPRHPDHPRAVQVDGDLGLASVGAAFDYGWFSANLTAAKASHRELRFLGGLPDALAWLDEERIQSVRDGRITLDMSKGDHVLALLARHTPRPFDGTQAPGEGDRPGALVAVEPLKGVKRSMEKIDPADPFEVRRFVLGAADGQRTTAQAETLSFTHRRKTRVLVDVPAGIPGICLLNGELLAFHDGRGMTIQLVHGETEGFKSGANIFAFAPLENARTEDADGAIAIHDIVEELIPKDGWRFRRWERPDRRIGTWRDLQNSEESGDGMPRWYRTTVSKVTNNTGSGHLEIRGLSRGRAWLNGVPLGAYDLKLPGTTEATASNVKLPVPPTDSDDASTHELLLFDEGGDDPADVSIRL